MGSIFNQFKITNHVVVITGGSGLLGKKHCEAVLEGEGIPVLIGTNQQKLDNVKKEFAEKYPQSKIEIYQADITKKSELELVKNQLMEKYGHIDALINNAANNPKVEGGSKNLGATSFCDFPEEIWAADVSVGLTGAIYCCQVFGKVMEEQRKGVVINISSDYGIVAPDQRIYRKDGVPEEEQIIKPVSYSVIKHGINGLTKYLATYWAQKGIRVNTLSPTGIYNGQPDEFVKKFSELVPMGRMSKPEEYPATVLYMLSEASSFMTGATVVLDGGRTIW
ncbi:MAG: SDR family oxidoreductase [Lachnospiraceae bacterium]|nr:SDR family oxidoreductase [Lachnospiraceae bacterium]MBQ8263088.1 SDR family oxidoreductase [Lachnospiraceae bacterium]